MNRMYQNPPLNKDISQSAYPSRQPMAQPSYSQGQQSAQPVYSSNPQIKQPIYPFNQSMMRQPSKASIRQLADSVNQPMVEPMYQDNTSAAKQGDPARLANNRSAGIINIEIKKTDKTEDSFDFEPSPKKLQEAIIWSEIIGKPVSKRGKRRYHAN